VIERVLGSRVKKRLAVPPVPAARWNVALVVALVADALELGLAPVFGGGALAIPDDVLDLVTAFVLLVALGPRPRLVAALALELVPGATLLPTWTAVVLSLPRAPAALPTARGRAPAR
jgi:hypothetical protein